MAMEGEAAAAELEEAKGSLNKIFKKVAKTKLHELEIGEIPLARIVECRKAG